MRYLIIRPRQTARCRAPRPRDDPKWYGGGTALSHAERLQRLEHDAACDSSRSTHGRAWIVATRIMGEESAGTWSTLLRARHCVNALN